MSKLQIFSYLCLIIIDNAPAFGVAPDAFRRDKLAREDLARAQVFQDRVDALQRISSRFDKDVGQKLREEKSLNEKRIMEDLDKRERADALAEQLKQENRKNTIKRNFQYNIAMIEEKQAAKERERMLALESRLRMQQDLREQESRERKIQQEKRLKNLELKHKLDEQVEQTHARKTNESVLSNIEKDFNKVMQ